MSTSLVARRQPASIAWLLPVVPALEPISPECDLHLSAAALAALSGDTAARDALFTAFEPRLDRSIRRCQRLLAEQSQKSVEDAIEPEDVSQEAYLVFVELLESWSGDGSISSFVAARFAWRLNDVVRTWRRRRTSSATRSPLRCFASPDQEIAELIDEVTGNMHPSVREMVRWRVFERLTFPQIAKRAGVSTRTVGRRWDELAAELRASNNL